MAYEMKQCCHFTCHICSTKLIVHVKATIKPNVGSRYEQAIRQWLLLSAYIELTLVSHYLKPHK